MIPSRHHSISTKSLQPWPVPLSDGSALSSFDELPPTYEAIKCQVERVGDVIIRIVTWNQEAKEPPTAEELAKHLFPSRRYHVIVVGTQECENTFAKSIILPSKIRWEGALNAALGTDYDSLHSHSLQASHLIVFVHKAIAHWVSNIRSFAVPTGLGDTLGNKGGIGITLTIGESTFCFINAHLAAHQHATNRRASEFRKISTDIATKILHQQQNISDTRLNKSLHRDQSARNSNVSRNSEDLSLSDMDCIDYSENVMDDGEIIPKPSMNYTHFHYNENIHTEADIAINPLIKLFDYIFWFGDLNFRINGTREVVDGMLENHMHDALLYNDQLSMLLRFNRIFLGFSEGPVNFLPTYKFDHNSDHYDTSQKRRVPSWTDRILFKTNLNAKVLSYCSAPEIRTSDHRPVYATFRCRVDVSDEIRKYEVPAWEVRRETKSEVCCIS